MDGDDCRCQDINVVTETTGLWVTRVWMVMKAIGDMKY